MKKKASGRCCGGPKPHIRPAIGNLAEREAEPTPSSSQPSHLLDPPLLRLLIMFNVRNRIYIKEKGRETTQHA